MDNNWIQHGRTNLESHLCPPKMKAGEQALPRQEQIAMALTFCFISLHFMAWPFCNSSHFKSLHRRFKKDPQIRHVQSLRNALGSASRSVTIRALSKISK